MRRKVLGAAVVLAVGAAGCGGSDAPTAASFRQEANTMCAQAVKHAQSMQGSIGTKLVAYQDAKLAVMHKLTPPAELQRRYDAYAQALSARRDLYEQYDRLTQAKLPTDKLAKRAHLLLHQESDRAKALGLSACHE
jgi:hypothetical protein